MPFWKNVHLPSKVNNRATLYGAYSQNTGPEQTCRALQPPTALYLGQNTMFWIQVTDFYKNCGLAITLV